MKIRQGFVSNSSSASYIVKIDGIDFHEFCDRIESSFSFYDYFSVKKMMADIDAMLDNDYLSVESKKRIEQRKKELSEIDEYNFYEVVRFALKINLMGFKELSNGIELVDFTAMHNDFDSGMSPLMKEIVLFCMFETKYRLMCEVEHDG